MGTALDSETAAQARAGHAGRIARALEKLRPRLRIAVVFGGDARAPGTVLQQTHNPRAWKSYEAVANDIAGALRTLGFAAVEVMPEDRRLADRLAAFGADLVWLNTGGVQGEAPVAHAAAQLEMLGVPYVGLDPLNAAMLDAKNVFKTQLQGMGLPTAPFTLWDPADAMPAWRDITLERFLPDHGGAFVVKPVSGRASLHVEVADTRADLPRVAAAVAAASGTLAMIEPYLGGTEYCVAVTGAVVCRRGVVEIGEAPFAFSPIERRLDPGERIAPSMDRKPVTPHSYRLLGDADAAARTELLDLGRRVYASMRLDSVVRLDLRRDGAGRLMILEANPKPDLKRPSETVTSLVCAGLGEHGMAYEDLILSIIANRVARYLLRTPKAAPRIVELAE